MKTRLILFLLFAPMLALSQQGNIEGRVLDRTNNDPVAFANVVISGTTIGTITTEKGEFRLSGIKPGFVRIQVSLLGYSNAVSPEIDVRAGKTVFVDVTMERSTTEIEEITVAASPYRRTEESPLSLTTIGLSEIENSPGANRDISKVIQSFAGVQSSPSFRNDIIIRGGGPAESRFFLDGIEIPNLNHFATQGASGGAVGILNADLLREVQYYSGAFPADRGNALSGVFDFSLADGNPDRVRGQATLGATELSVTADGPVGDKTTFIVSARRSYLKFLFTALELPFLPTFNDLQFKVKTRINTKNELTFIGLGAYDLSELNTKIDHPDDKQKYIIASLPDNTQWSYTLGASWKHFDENGYQTLVVSRSHLSNEASKYLDNDKTSEANKNLDYRSQEAVNKLRYESFSQSGRAKITFGGNLDLVHYTNSTMQKRYYATGPVTVDYNTSLDFLKWGVFGQASNSYIDNRLTLSFGVRLDAATYSGDMSSPFDQFSPRLSASWQLKPAWTLNVNAGRYYQLPPLTAMGFRQADAYVNKANGLRFIQSDHLVAGVAFQPKPNTFFSFETFFKNYSRYPFSVNDSVSLANLGADYGVVGNEEVTSESKGHAWGFELQGRHSVPGNFNINLSYTFVRSEFRNGQGHLIPSSWDARHILVVTSTKKLKRNWQVGGRWRLAGGLPYTPWDLDRSSLVDAWNANNGPYLDTRNWNSRRFSAFHQLDVRIDKAYYLKKMTAKFYIDIQNLYNFKNQERDVIVRAEDADGNLVTTDNGTRYQLKQLKNDSGTVLPTIGIILQF